MIYSAQRLSNSDNSAYLDFALATSLLNKEWRSLYDQIVTGSRDFVRTIEVSRGQTLLPSDCYLVTEVRDLSGNLLSRDSYYGDNGGYMIENCTIKVPCACKVTYSVVPDTLTAPDEREPLSDDTTYYNGEQGIPDMTTAKARKVVKDGDNIYIEDISEPVSYLGKTLIWDLSAQTFTWDGYDVSDKITRDGDDVTDVQVHSPYMLISYASGLMMVFTGWRKAVWNYNCIHGHDTRGRITALYTDDMTGKGCVWLDYDDGKYYYCSFVPDTILSYPTSALFTLMEYRLAATMLSLLGMENQYLLQTLLPNAEGEFYRTLHYGSVRTRMPNFLRRTIYGL